MSEARCLCASVRRSLCCFLCAIFGLRLVNGLGGESARIRAQEGLAAVDGSASDAPTSPSFLRFAGQLAAPADAGHVSSGDAGRRRRASHCVFSAASLARKPPSHASEMRQLRLSNGMQRRSSDAGSRDSFVKPRRLEVTFPGDSSICSAMSDRWRCRSCPS